MKSEIIRFVKPIYCLLLLIAFSCEEASVKETQTLSYDKLSTVVNGVDGFAVNIGLLLNNVLVRETVLNEHPDEVSTLQKQVDANCSNEAAKELVELFESSGFNFGVNIFFENMKTELQSKYQFEEVHFVQVLDEALRTHVESNMGKTLGSREKNIYLGVAACSAGCWTKATLRYPMPENANNYLATLIGTQQSAYYLGCFECCTSTCFN